MKVKPENGYRMFWTLEEARGTVEVDIMEEEKLG